MLMERKEVEKVRLMVTEKRLIRFLRMKNGLTAKAKRGEISRNNR